MKAIPGVLPHKQGLDLAMHIVWEGRYSGIENGQAGLVCEGGRWVVKLGSWLVNWLCNRGGYCNVELILKPLLAESVSSASLCKRVVFTSEGNTEFVLRTGH